ncbi:uncharacterized protein LOC112271677 [Brachypodium distachyon]|uniref:uncharacterized protein LOC112271677 n=1 Tax=Brachypodium distachyon TaxID=15368 RepID=UPI000D0E3373|nr:uncharacterized protein LOC112271677 [Brachypodium distachyon]|eukprot:XP_024317191.1 uncharacterized protein LOC112271677 [Brachypodium distachyon]
MAPPYSLFLHTLMAAYQLRGQHSGRSRQEGEDGHCTRRAKQETAHLGPCQCQSDRHGASSAATTLAANPILVEEEPAAGEIEPATDSLAAGAGTEGDKAPLTRTAAPQGPFAPTTRADTAVIDLTSDIEDVGLREKPEAAPAPSSAAPDTTAAVPTVATGAELSGASLALQAGGAGPAAAPQETTPARGAALPPDPQPMGAGAGKEVAGVQQVAPMQADDAPPGQTMAAGASSSSATTSSPDFGILAGATWDPITWDPSIYDQGHQFLDAIKEQQLAFITSFNKVRELHELAKSQLDEVWRDVERERQELSRLRK